MFATLIAKPFIRFDPLSKHQKNTMPKFNSSRRDHLKMMSFDKNLSLISTIAEPDPDYINLRVPYWIAGSISAVLAFLFLTAQIYETKNQSRNSNSNSHFIMLNNEDSDCETKTNVANHAAQDDDDDPVEHKPNKFNYLMQKLLFTNKIYEGKALIYMLTQIFLFILGN